MTFQRPAAAFFVPVVQEEQAKQWSRFIRPNNEDICLSSSPAIPSSRCTPGPSAKPNGPHKGKQLTPRTSKKRDSEKKKQPSYKFPFNHEHFASS